MMRQAIGEKDAPELQPMLNLRYPEWPAPAPHFELEPNQQYVRRYELWIVVEEATDPVEAYRQALIEWYNKLLEIDKEVVIYPWAAVDRQAGTTAIKELDEFPTSFSSIKKYMPKAWLRLKGGMLYPKIMVGMLVEPETLIEDISWWLQSTKQGMWAAQLQDAKEMVCLGWLLFSTDELDKTALQTEIWQMTGVQVLLRF